MSQAFSLYEELSVIQNLLLHARLFQLPPAHRESRVAQLLDQFSLTEYRDQLATALHLVSVSAFRWQWRSFTNPTS